jgi:hypothetical protein
MKSLTSQVRWQAARRLYSNALRLAVVPLIGSLACGTPPVRFLPIAPKADLPRAFDEAFRTEAIGDSHAAIDAHLGVVENAARADGDPWQVAALEASLDALALRAMPSLGDASSDAALATRTLEGDRIAHELSRIASQATGPFSKGLIARALTSMAQRRGDADEAKKWRTATACVREALVIGPTAWAPVTGVDEPGLLDRADAPILTAYATGDAFGTTVTPVPVRDRGCAIDLSAASARPGVREVVVDVNVPRGQTIGVALRAHGAAALRVGGMVVIRRRFELGDGEAARFAQVAVTAGELRIVARVGTAREQDSIEVDLWGQDGRPLESRVPALGSTAGARAIRAQAIAAPSPNRPEEMLLASAAALAAGDARDAERMLWPGAARAEARPELALVYGRAVENAQDLSPATRSERARGAYERTLELWPTSWEASIAHAVLAGMRRGRDEAGIETLRDLEAQRAKQPNTTSPMLDAFESLTSGREHLFDRASAAFARAQTGLGGTTLLADIEDAGTPRTGAELLAATCSTARAARRDTLACFDALRATGDHGAAMRELTRLQQVLGAPTRFAALELREAIAANDRAAIAGALANLLPGERTIGLLAPTLLAERIAPDAPRGLLALAPEMRDAPASIAPLLRASGDDPTREFDGVAERLAAQDRADSIMPGAATAVLTHVERYDVGASGLVRWILFDVRRVSGTTDVEENAQAAAPELWGRAAMRALRRRIFKRDGRVLEPERTPRASQAHADLAQLEQGDVVEAIYEGWLLPGDTGDIGIDTTDLLPERTAVHQATVELRLPRDLRGSVWSHPLLGKATERTEFNSRVLSWHLVDQPARRIEDGVPKMDRSAEVSFSTTQWQGVARVLRETIASLGEHDPEITAWAREAAEAAGGKPTRSTVDAVVAAAGKALREADASTFSDYGGSPSPAQSRTARTFLTSHDGSRSWLVVRALQELGIPCDLVVAESEPYSADPSFPPHFGRFSHPLVVAHLPATSEDASGRTLEPETRGDDVWIDADVQGPPLPAGRVSPELRGRLALRTDGMITQLPALGREGERDEVDVRLALDANGNARGTLAVVLRGREAQELSEAFFRVVGAERQQALRDVVLAWLPWANVDEVQLDSSEGSWQISLRADVSVSGYAQLEGGKTWLLPGLDTLHSSWPHSRVSTLGATFATRAGRESALALSTAVQYHVHRRVELPKGASVARLPGPIDVRAKFVEASRAIGVDRGGQVIEDDFVLGVATGTIAAKDYDAFVAVTRQADDGFLASTRVAVP